jgi:N-acetyl-gamma-glutamyl-phosphate reductase
MIVRTWVTVSGGYLKQRMKSVSSKILKVGIVGATGYTGVELLRLLVGHEYVDIQVVTSNSEKDQNVTDVFPSLSGYLDLKFSEHDSPVLTECDVVFFATPHATSMYKIPELLDANVKIIDLSADFRLQDAEQWQYWYGIEHAAPELLESAVYGLPEINRDQISKADLVANPGCYPTAVLLGLLPLLEAGIVDLNSLIADAKSGVSGAGRKADMASLFSEASETFKAYGVSGHRHLPEICQTLSLCSGQAVDITFVPHLVPMVRGIFATLYARLKQMEIDVTDIYTTRYINEPFVEVLPNGSQPDTRGVRGTNMCRIVVSQGQGDDKAQGSDKIVVLSVIDNLVKGAAGQAIQNMNIMFGLDEVSGLNLPAIYP